MLLPKGVALYQRLDTAFTSLPELLRVLKEEKFYGYVEVRSRGYQGVLVCDAGDVVSASEETEGGRHAGEDAMAGVLARAGQRGGEINVIQASPEMVYHYAALGTSQAVYTDLSSEFTRLDKLLADLVRRRHSGHVEVLFGNGDMGLLFLAEGEPVQCLYGAPEDGPVAEGGAFQSILERAERERATISVFRAARELPPRPGMSSAAGNGDRRAQLFGGLQRILGEVEAVVDGLTRPGTFGAAFQRALQECSAEFPFLDPFEGLFEFKAGQVAFRGEEAPEVVIPAVRSCLVHALNALAHDGVLPARELWNRLHAMAPDRARELPEQLRAWGFDLATLASGG
jgi:hypothetical protein